MAKQTFTTGQVLTAAQVNSLQSNDFNQTVSVKTASYTLVAADKGTRIEFNTSGSVTCTVNTGLFDAGDTLIIQNRGAGVVTVTAGTATVNTSATLALSQYDAGTLYFVSASAAIFFNTDAGGGSPLTTKGDLYTFSTVDARLPVGTNGYTLVADSAETTGLKWAAAGFPASTSFTPTVTAQVGTITTYTAQGYYWLFGKICIANYKITLTTVGTAAGTLFATLPFTARSLTNAVWTGACVENATSGKTGTFNVASNQTTLNSRDYNFVTWFTNGYTIDGSIAYEVA